MKRPAVLKVLFVGLILISQFVRAQDVAARLESDTTRIRIGESLTLRLQLSQPKGLDISWPSWLDSLAGAEILHVSDVDTPVTNDEAVLLRSQSVVVTSFDSGSLLFLPIQFNYTKPDGKRIRFETDPLSVEVIPVQVDTTQAFRDIKGNVSVPFDYLMIAMWISGGVILTLVLWWLYRRFKNKVEIKESDNPIVAIPSDMRALEELKRLDEEKVWQSGDQKGYHTRLTDILRTYIHERYDVNAPELTTDDLVGHSLVRSLPASSRESLERILRLADLVKFAKYDSLPDECVWAMGAAEAFVTATRLRTETTIVSANQGENGTVD